MSKRFKLKSLIFCDDIRIEIDRKEILIGVYSGGIVVPSLPFLLPTFVVRVEIQTELLDFDECSLQIKSARQTLVAEGRMQIQKDPHFRKEFSLPLQFKFSPFVIGETGKHSVLFSTDDRLTNIGSFIVEKSLVVGATTKGGPAALVSTSETL